uniref:Uncharacterized protein n=1 Tax=Rhizophora mucronata TaxID=61149 RepID=A0A2P2QLA8_RHIMU
MFLEKTELQYRQVYIACELHVRGRLY